VSRQRLKSTKASSSFMECPTCQGDGTIRTPEAAARAAFRKIQARVVRGDISGVKVFLPPEVALYLLNQKRDDLTRLEQRYKVAIEAVPESRLKASQFEIEEVRREETEITPVVTADTVDQALAAGTFQPPARPVVEPQESAPAKEAPREQTEPAPKGRRRRRRRHGRGAGLPPVSEAAGRADGSTPAPPIPAHAAPSSDGVRDNDQNEAPVFSEGPEADEAGSRDLPGTLVSTGPSLPRLAEVPGGAAAAQGAQHRRRRRRRRRGRGGGAGLQAVASPQAPARGGAGRAGARVGFSIEAGPASREDRRADPGLSTAPVAVEFAPPPETGRAASPPDRAISGRPPETPAEPKPKRRWWRRSFTKG